VRVRKQLLAIAENPMRPWYEEVQTIANLLTDNWDDELLRGNFVDLVLQLAVEQPLKTPFLAAVVLIANTNQPELVDMLLAKLASHLQEKISQGRWRETKLYLKLLACLQSCLEGDGIFPVLDELFSRAGDLQMASSEDVSPPATCWACRETDGGLRLLAQSLSRSFCSPSRMSCLPEIDGLPRLRNSWKRPTSLPGSPMRFRF
jgi:hypothetical protein